MSKNATLLVLKIICVNLFVHNINYIGGLQFQHHLRFKDHFRYAERIAILIITEINLVQLASNL